MFGLTCYRHPRGVGKKVWEVLFKRGEGQWGWRKKGKSELVHRGKGERVKEQIENK